MGLVDLHMHSRYSDGTCDVKELVDLVAKRGIKYFSLTDHDNIRGVREAEALAREYLLIFIPGVEITTMYKGDEVHILGYFIDIDDKEFLSFLDRVFSSRIKRVKQTITNLNRMGYDITFEDVKKAGGCDYVGRPHIARALMEKGYISEVKEAFTPELIGNGGRAYVPPDSVSPRQAIEIIEKNGGMSVVAHPGIYNNGSIQGLQLEDIRAFVSYGLDGVEVFHTKHDERARRYYLSICRRLNLRFTCGSDFHGKNASAVIGETGIPSDLESEVISLINERMRSKIRE